MKRRILMVGSVPLAGPWNGADKNIAGLLVRRDKHNLFVVHTNLTEPWDPQRVTAVRSARADSMPTLGQRVRGLAYMLRHSGSADLIHAVASLYRPSPWAGPLLNAYRTARSRPLVHTVPSVGDIAIERRNFPGDATVVLSEHTRRRLKDHGIEEVFKVHPPVELERLRPGAPSAPARWKDELRLGERAVLYPAHYGEESGIREIIRAFSRLRGFPRAEAPVLVLACRSHPWQDAQEERRRVLEQAEEAGIRDRVRVLGSVADMPALISACAVTALVPKKLGGKMDLPLVILEALALGRPVVVADQAPMNEALLGGGGCAVPHGDVPALAVCLARLLEEPRLRTELGGQGREAVRRYCDPDKVVEDYRRIYESVLEPKEAPSRRAAPGELWIPDEDRYPNP